VSPADAPFSCCDELVQPLPKKEPKKEQVAHFAMERTGLQGSGLLGGNAFERGPALCLTATDKENRVGGLGLRLQPCDNSFDTFGSKVPNNTSPELRAAQTFVLDPSGTVQSLGKWLCIRRMRCGNKFLYDLGRCDGPGYSAVFQVDSPLSSSIDNLSPLGHLFHAVKRQRCITCGPYVLKERCLTRGEKFPSAQEANTCGEMWQAKPGWSRMPTTYVGDDVANGRRSVEESYDGVYDRLVGSDDTADMAGLMATDFDGICGSYMTDGSTMDSIFYLHRLV